MAQASNDELSNKNEVCVGPSSEKAGKASSCEGCPNKSECASGKYREEDPSLDEVAARLEGVRYILLVLSGKGGVGKSTVSSQLAWTLASWGLQVGILDIDICGPSVARMMGVENQSVRQSANGWNPVYCQDNLAVMSVAFMLNNKNDAIIWRGPRKTGLIKQFLTDVTWNECDYLIIDAPPGTSDEHISIHQYLKKMKNVFSIIVTTPQEVSLLDVRKEISFCQKTHINILGVIENMSGFICPCCNTKTNIFPATTGGAKKMCIDMKQKYLGNIPIEPNLLKACDEGKCFVQQVDENNLTRQSIENVIENIANALSNNEWKYIQDIKQKNIKLENDNDIEEEAEKEENDKKMEENVDNNK